MRGDDGWADIMELGNRITALESENARLLGQMAGLDNALLDKDKVIDRLKAELEKVMNAEIHEQARLINERDRWKELAGKLAEALEDLLNHGTPVPSMPDGVPVPYQAHPEWAEEALALYAARVSDKQPSSGVKAEEESHACPVDISDGPCGECEGQR